MELGDSVVMEPGFECSGTIDKLELEEVCDDMDVMEICEKVEKSELFDSEYDEELYHACVVAEERDREQSKSHTERGTVMKRIIEEEENREAKKPQHEERSTTSTTRIHSNQVPTTSTTDKVVCKTCNVTVRRKYFAHHSRSNLHKNNLLHFIFTRLKKGEEVIDSSCNHVFMCICK